MKAVPLIVALTGCHDAFDLEKVTLTPEIDASPVDAFNPDVDCPVGYTTALQGQSSRYRIIGASQTPLMHFNECAADGAITHLAVLEAPGEQQAVQALLDVRSDDMWFVGAVQLRDQINARQGWLWLNGDPILLGAFDPAGSSGGEPNDMDGVEDNTENVAYLRTLRGGLIDVPKDLPVQAICECDGRAMDPTAAAAYMSNS